MLRGMEGARDIVFIVDDDERVRHALESLVRAAGYAVETFENTVGFLARPRATEAQCLVLDIDLPDGNGLELQETLAASHPDLPILFVTGQADIPMTVRAMKAGAVEFFTKPCPNDELLRGIARALTRSRELQQREAEMASLRERAQRLTPRERQVMQLVVTGAPNKAIAAELGTSEVTVKIQRGQMMRKMEADSVAALVRMTELLGGATLAPAKERG